MLQLNISDLIKGAILLIGLLFFLDRQVSFFIVDPTYVSSPVYLLINTLGFLFTWLLLTFLINKVRIYKVLGVLSLLIISGLADDYLDVSGNPITIPLLILFWLCFAYLILPQFFKKYQVAILSVYSLIIFYYLFIFFTISHQLASHRSYFSNFLWYPLPAFTSLWIYEQWRWLKTLKADKAKAELALLKSQINPHFFFNTLNNLYGLVVEKSAQAPEVILKLSDIMRYTIYQGKEELVSLKEEINYLENYIELHQIRYQKRVDITFVHEVDQQQKVAPLLFIILLENAFKHGVEKMRANAYIHLQMHSHGKQLLFTIENNFDQVATNQPAGIGLDNLNKRLAFLYPNQHELVVRQKETSYQVQLNLELT
ncbi:MAG: histidine kinase [Bacteroidota bacterium]